MKKAAINARPESHLKKMQEDLRVEINKGWDGKASKRTVKDIIAAKRIRKSQENH